MKFSKAILSTAVLFASSMTVANTYHAEVGLNYTDLDNDATQITLNGRYHFTEVDTSNKPLAEAAFLQKRSFINASHTEFDFDGFNADAQTVGVGFYIPNSIFYVGATYYKLEDDNDTLIEVGITPVDGLLVTTQHFTESDDYTANIQAKYVRPLSNDTAINVEAGFVKGEDGFDDTFGVAADYYFTNFFSVGAMVSDSDDTSYGIRTRYFFNDSFSVNGEVTSQDNADTYTIGAAFRF